MTAIQESFSNHSFTSATIISRQGFNLPSSNLIFEIRTSLPTYGGLSGQVMLIPAEQLNETLKGAIFIMENHLSNIGFGLINYPDKLRLNDSEINLSHFQIYRFQSKPDINFSIITMSINGETHRIIEYETNMFFSKTRNVSQDNFRLVFNLLINGSRQKGLVDKIVQDSVWWKCSSMIIDYVKVYYLDMNETFNEPISNLSGKSSWDICPKRISKRTNNEFLYYFFGVILFIMGLILVVVFIKFRKTKIKLKNIQGNNEIIYDDNDVNPEEDNYYYSVINENIYDQANECHFGYVEMEASTSRADYLEIM